MVAAWWLVALGCGDGGTIGMSCRGSSLLRAEVAHGAGEIVVHEPEAWEIHTPILCTVRLRGVALVKDDWFDTEIGAARQRYAVLNPHGPVVGLTRSDQPDTVLFAIDLRSGRSWPKQLDLRMAHEMIATLRAATGRSLTLGAPP